MTSPLTSRRMSSKSDRSGRADDDDFTLDSKDLELHPVRTVRRMGSTQDNMDMQVNDPIESLSAPPLTVFLADGSTATAPEKVPIPLDHRLCFMRSWDLGTPAYLECTCSPTRWSRWPLLVRCLDLRRPILRGALSR
jgi:hypothetical protein